VRVELDLAGTVEKDKRVVGKVVELVHEPVNVLDEVLHTVDEASVRSPILSLLDIVEGDQIANVDINLVLEDLSGWVKVANFVGPAHCGTYLLEYVAKSGFS